MKKDTLCDLYDILGNNPTKITDSLYKLMLLSNGSEELFLKFCKSNSVNEETFDYFINISECLDEIENEEIKNDLFNSISDITNDPFISNNEDYDYILECFIFLFDYDYIKDFDIYEDFEADYYKSILVKEFIRFLKNMKNININYVYEHDMGEILDAYRMMLGGLFNTTTKSNELSYNQMFIDRIKYFIDIISDKDIYEIDNEKFQCVLNVVKSTTNIEELKHLKNIIKINRKKDVNDFIESLDSASTDLNELTIQRITKKLGIKRHYDNKTEQTIVKRNVKDLNKELDIVKKVLKPLD